MRAYDNGCVGRIRPVQRRRQIGRHLQSETSGIRGPGDDNAISKRCDAQRWAVKPRNKAVKTAAAVQGEVVKVSRADKEAGNVSVSARVHADAITPIVMRSSGLLNPQHVATPLEFGAV